MKRFITVRMWEETKDKLEQVRIDIAFNLCYNIYVGGISKG